MKIKLIVFLFALLLFGLKTSAEKTLTTKEISFIFNKVEEHNYAHGKDSVYFEKLNYLKSNLDKYIKNKGYNDTIVKIYVFYAYSIRFKEPLKSVKIAQRLIEVVKKENIYSAEANVMHLLASLYYHQGLINEAVNIYIISSLKFKKDGDLIGYAYALVDIGNVYFRIKDYKNAKQYYKNAEDVFMELYGNKRNQFYGLAVVFNNYGLIHFENKDFAEALRNFKKAYRLRKNNNLTSVIPHSHYYLGNTYLALGNKDSSYFHYKKAVEISYNNNIENEIPVSLYKYGEYFLNINPDSALYYFNKSMKIADKINEVEQKMISRNAIGFYYLDKNTDSAEVYFKQLFDIANRINSIDFIKTSSENLISIYNKRNDYKNKSKYTDIVNDLLERQAKKNILKAQLALEHNKWLEKNTKLEEKSSRQKIRFIYLFIFSIIAISFAVILLYNRKRIKQKSKELERKNKELKNVIDKRNTLYTIIAHDLKGPLGSGIKLIELINSQEIPKEMIAEMMNKLEKNFKATYSLLTNLLSWVNIHKENFNINASQNFVYKIIHESEILYKEKFEEKNIKLTNRIDKNIKAYFDYNSVSTVARNLISNAIKYSNNGGEIIVNAIDKESFIEISFKDNGVGISKERFDKIFNTDYIESTSGTNNESGTGLGLKLCKSLIELNNGKIYFESNQGEGATFYFTLLKSKPIQN